MYLQILVSIDFSGFGLLFLGVVGFFVVVEDEVILKRPNLLHDLRFVVFHQ